MNRTITLIAFAIALAACPKPVPPDAPVVDADGGDYPAPGELPDTRLLDGTPEADASPCGRACENLRAILCSDGFPYKGITCFRACMTMATQQRVPTKCWSNATSLEAARACGGLRCRTR